MADRHVVFKQCLKEVAEQHGPVGDVHGEVRRGPRGLELPHPSQPVAGRQERLRGRHERSGPCKCSDAFRWFLGGWIAHVPDVMVFYAPTVNSYKRYVDASWAPTRLAWSYDNRTAGFRVVGDGPERCGSSAGSPAPTAIRISRSPRRSRRVSTASANRTEPPECFAGDIYAARHLPRVPTTPARGDRSRSRASEFATRRLRRRRGRALRPLLPDRARGVFDGGHRLGAAALLRADLTTNGTASSKDKVALITGAGSGIGRESALLFAREGAAIVAVDVDDTAGAATRSTRVEAAGGRAVVVARRRVAGARTASAWSRAAERTFGKLNVLFNNAGIMHSEDDDAVSTDEAVWDADDERSTRRASSSAASTASRRCAAPAAARSSTRRRSWRCSARRRRRSPTRRARARCWR